MIVLRKILISLAYAATMLLGSCTKREHLRFCQRENRVIPDAELKGRLLANIRNTGGLWGKLPDYLEAYLAKRLSASASNEQLQLR